MSAEFVDLYNAIRCDDQMAYSEDALAHLNETVQHSGDTLLHVAAKWKRRNIAETMINLQPSLLLERNIKGETPLHIAATVGSQDVTRLIIDWCDHNETVENGEWILRKKTQKEEETALHRAVRNGHFEVVRLLIEKDTELAKLENKEGDSPLFIAVEAQHFEIALFILTASNCSCRGRKNMNALHAAIARQRKVINLNGIGYLISNFSMQVDDALALMQSYLKTWKSTDSGDPSVGAKENQDEEAQAMNPMTEESPWATRIAKVLIEKGETELLEQQDDEFGWTPLHYAAYMNATQIIELLLSAKHSVAYTKDHDGMTALHIAAKQGHVSAMESLVKICPEICDAVDNIGQSALHIAVKSGNSTVVRFIVESFDDGTINMQDYQGNTALQLAASQERLSRLFFEGKKKSRLINGGGTVSLEQCLGRKKDENIQDQQLEQTQKTGQGKTDEWNMTQIKLIIATLIATVSFAAGLSVPGGFKDNGPDEGTALLAKKRDFHIFVISNAIAFCFSVSSILATWIPAVFTAIISASSTRPSLTSVIGVVAYPLIEYSILCMIVAFIYGTSALLGDSEARLVTNVKIICSMSFLYFWLLCQMAPCILRTMKKIFRVYDLDQWTVIFDKYF